MSGPGEVADSGELPASNRESVGAMGKLGETKCNDECSTSIV